MCDACACLQEGEAEAASSAEWDSDDDEEGSGRAAAWEQAPEPGEPGARLAAVSKPTCRLAC